MADTSQNPMTKPIRITYGEAICLVLQNRPMRRERLMSYFADEDHVNVGRALNELVLSGDVDFNREVYRRRPPTDHCDHDCA